MRSRIVALFGLASLLIGVTAFFSGGATAAPSAKVLVFVGENHSRSSAIAGMPYLNGLRQAFRDEPNYSAITHPSEPNYLDIWFGSNMGSTSDHNPAYQAHGQSVAGEAFAAGGTAGTYAETMVSNCQQTDQGGYAVKHNPWASAADERTLCNAHDVPMGTSSSGNMRSAVNAGTLPNVALAIPNLCNDAHDCSLGTFDNWLKAWIPVVQGGPDYQSGNLTIVVTFDEGSSSDNRVLTVLISKGYAGYGSDTTTLNHYSLSRLLSETTGSAPLRNAANATAFPK